MSLAAHCRCLCMPALVTKVKETQEAAQGIGTDSPNAKYMWVWARMTVICYANLSQCGAGLAYSSCRLLTVVAGICAVLSRAPSFCDWANSSQVLLRVELTALLMERCGCDAFNCTGLCLNHRFCPHPSPSPPLWLFLAMQWRRKETTILKNTLFLSSCWASVEGWGAVYILPRPSCLLLYCSRGWAAEDFVPNT